jgi:hypothetical protein
MSAENLLPAFMQKRDPSVYDVLTASRFFFGKTDFRAFLAVTRLYEFVEINLPFVTC